MMGHIVSAAALSLAFVMTACGDDSSSGSQGESSEGVTSLDELDKCSKSLYGEVVYVEDENAYFECSKDDKDWVKIDSTNHEAKSSSSKKESKESSSSTEKKDSNKSSSSTDKKDSNESSSSTEKTPSVVVKDKSISGVSQKGPFVTGSTVKVYELDNNLAQTGNSFTGKINSDDGKFSVNSVSLANKYALLEANGYFRNEITGEKSKSPITLYALTDLSEREKVNVNLMTHLEYERTLYLVNEKEMSVSEAKKQAESEILKAFGIEGKFGSSEDLDIFGTGDGNAALLAISVMLLRDLSEADLTEELTKFATDIEKDGSWDDEGTIAEIGMWASKKDLSGELGSIYSNISHWKLGTYPPAFEKYIRNFWYAYFELDECNNDSEGKVMGSEKSEYNASDRYICKNGAWVTATDREKDTYQWEPGEDGEVRAGDIIEVNHYMYYEPYKRWDYMFSFDIPKDYHFNPKVTYGEMTDSRDQKKYKTVTIGEGEKAQTWMAENLNYEIKTNSMCYDDVLKNCDVSGRLYKWYAAMNKQPWEINSSGVSNEIVQGVCPQGWHLPTKKELDVLIENVGGELSSAGKKLKAKSGWKDRYNDQGDVYGEYDPSNWERGAGTDDFGFSALATGHGSNELDRENYSSYDAGTEAYFWSSSDKGAYYRLENHSDYFSYSDCDTPYNHCEDWADYEFASVRCIKDKAAE